MKNNSRFLAIDFETANYYPNSACAVGLVTVDKGRIKKKNVYLIRPPYKHFEFTDVHGITWKDVRSKPTFGELWEDIVDQFQGVDFLVAHNASFDSRVLQACCSTYGIDMPDKIFQCTVHLSRSVLGIRPANLPNVCRELGIKLNHHDAGSDSEACARIMIEILKNNFSVA
jgi:DNA polymerase-3 subunit epsilon